MTNPQNRIDFLRETVRQLMDSLTEAACAWFGEQARDIAAAIDAPQPPPGWRDDDFVDLLLLPAIPWMRAMSAAFGGDQVKKLVGDRIGQAMRAFGSRAAADSDGSIAARVDRYAELMAKIGARDLGPVLICNHDFVIANAMGLGLERSQTLMTSGRPCNFRYTHLGPAKAQPD